MVRKDNVTITLKSSVTAADELNGHFFMRMPMRIAHVGSLVDQHVIQNGAVTIGGIVQLLDKLGQVLHVVPIYLGIAGNIVRLVSVVGRSMPASIEAGFWEALSRQVAAQH